MEESLFNRRQVLTGSVIAALGALWLLLALCPLGTAWMRLSRVPQGVPSRSLSMGLVSPSPHSSLDAARWHACRSWTRAREAAAQELESLEEWDPKANMDFRREDWLRRLMAGDPHSDLQRADSAATRAARLARTPQERFEAVLLLSCIDCDLG